MLATVLRTSKDCISSQEHIEFKIGAKAAAYHIYLQTNTHND